jgi:fibronectin type 3 domain-containing protein
MANPAPAVVRDGSVSWTDEQIAYGRIYGYQIRVVSARGGISPLSAEAQAIPLLSLAVPQGLSAEGRDGYVQLAWKPVKTWLDGSPAEEFVGYNIYRGADQGVYEESPLNKKPLTTTSFRDTSVVNDRTYYYIVRSVDSPTLVWRESTDSPEASATPKDMTPPAPPSGLTAVPGVDRVFLTWNENKERDLAGYFVYRSTKSGRDYLRLTDKLLKRTTFSDDTVKSGTTYYYAVTAADGSGNESARSKEKTVFVEKLR